MKKEYRNVRIVADNGEAVLLSKKRYYSLLRTLDVLASGAQNNDQHPHNNKKMAIGRE